MSLWAAVFWITLGVVGAAGLCSLVDYRRSQNVRKRPDPRTWSDGDRDD